MKITKHCGCGEPVELEDRGRCLEWRCQCGRLNMELPQLRRTKDKPNREEARRDFDLLYEGRVQ